MNVKIIRIGNSKGVRIPRSVLDRCNIEDQVEMKVENGKIVLTPLQGGPRQGWEEAAKLMHERNDDEMLIPDVFPDEEFGEW
jgi:antitoxin MazE